MAELKELYRKPSDTQNNNDLTPELEAYIDKVDAHLREAGLQYVIMVKDATGSMAWSRTSGDTIRGFVEHLMRQAIAQAGGKQPK